ncbi:MAG: hypothetical protein RI885_1522 [Actinomycetota bacterium]
MLVTVGIVSLQSGAAIAALQFDVVGPVGATLLRLVFASVILCAVLRPRVWRWSRHEWFAVVFLGLALGGMNQLIYLSLDYIPLGVAITIEFLGPLVLALVHIRRWIDAVWAALALGGVALIGAQATGALSPIGIAFAVGAAVCWAAYILATANLGRRMTDSSGLAVSMVVAMLASVPLGLGGAVMALPRPDILLVFVLVAVMSSALPYTLELKALRRMPTRVFGILQSLGPAAAALAGLVLLGQTLSWPEITALVLVSVASIGISVTAARADATTAGSSGRAAI